MEAVKSAENVVSDRTGKPVLDTGVAEEWNAPYHTDDAKSSIGELKLIGGHIYDHPEKGKILLNEVVMNEIGGNEEDILMNTKMDAGRKFRMVLTRCLTRIGDGDGTYITDRNKMHGVVDSLTFADYSKMIIHLRMISVDDGEKYSFTTNCPGCGNEFHKVVDLTKLPITPMIRPMERVYDLDLPNGKRCRCRVMLGIDEEEMTVATDAGRDQLSTFIKIRLQEIDGQPMNMQDIKNLTLRERNYLRSAFEKKEGGVETGVPGSCSGCNRKFEIDIDITQKDFFFPSVTVQL
jgi:hypothetical protein